MNERTHLLLGGTESLQWRITELERRNEELAALSARESARRREVEEVLSERQRELAEA